MKFPCAIYLLQHPAQGYNTKSLLGKMSLPHPQVGEKIQIHGEYLRIHEVAHTPEEKYDFAVFVVPDRAEEVY